MGASWGVSVLIVRNLRMGNNFLCMPTRFCLKKTGPLLSHFIAIAIISIGSAKKIIPKNERKRSINLLKKCLYISNTSKFIFLLNYISEYSARFYLGFYRNSASRHYHSIAVYMACIANHGIVSYYSAR